MPNSSNRAGYRNRSSAANQRSGSPPFGRYRTTPPRTSACARASAGNSFEPTTRNRASGRAAAMRAAQSRNKSRPRFAKSPEVTNPTSGACASIPSAARAAPRSSAARCGEKRRAGSRGRGRLTRSRARPKCSCSASATSFELATTLAAGSSARKNSRSLRSASAALARGRCRRASAREVVHEYELGTRHTKAVVDDYRAVRAQSSRAPRRSGAAHARRSAARTSARRARRRSASACRPRGARAIASRATALRRCARRGSADRARPSCVLGVAQLAARSTFDEAIDDGHYVANVRGEARLREHVRARRGAARLEPARVAEHGRNFGGQALGIDGARLVERIGDGIVDALRQARRARRRGRRSARAAASARPVRPLTPCATASGKPSMLAATTGQPCAAASIATSPNASVIGACNRQSMPA